MAQNSLPDDAAAEFFQYDAVINTAIRAAHV